MKRRHFLTLGAGALATLGSGALTGCSGPLPPVRLGRIMTVRGALSPDALGTTLPHEHVMVDFTPLADPPPSYDRADVVDTVLPYLLEIKELGVQTLVDATPAYLGRDPILLRALSERSGLHVLTNTGYYGARDDAHLPDHAFTDTAEELAGRWIQEWRDGIGGSGVRPGLMKIGVDSGSLSDVDAKLVEAAGIAHRATGLTIAAHTGPAVPAFEQLEILEKMGVHPSAWIWVHAHGEEDRDAHVEAARRGAWVEFDGVRPETIDRTVDLVAYMQRRGQLGRVLVSQDAGWYSIGEEGGGEFRPFTTLITEFVPALQAAGFKDGDVDVLLRANPAEAFRIRVRQID